jgi:hypothetical protein
MHSLLNQLRLAHQHAQFVHAEQIDQLQAYALLVLAFTASEYSPQQRAWLTLPALAVYHSLCLR